MLHVVEAFSTGVFEMVRQIANAQLLAGHEVHIAHAQRPWTPERFDLMFADAVRFHRLAWGVRRRPAALVRGTAQLGRLMRRERYDIVHLHSTLAGLAGAVACPEGTTSIYTPNGYVFLMSSLPRPVRMVARGAEWAVARRVSLVGAVSEAEASEARGLGLAPDRVRIIHNGVAELDHIVERHEGEPGVGVAAAGRMSAQRQPRAVAGIFRRLPVGTPTMWIGDQADEHAAATLAAGGTRLTGWRSRPETLALVGRARVYLHWTAWDGHPLSVLEAIAAGTVVVAHDIPPVREILGDRWVHRSSVAAASMIERLLEDDDFYAEALEAQRRAAAPFSGAAMTRDWCALYESLTLGEGGR